MPLLISCNPFHDQQQQELTFFYHENTTSLKVLTGSNPACMKTAEYSQRVSTYTKWKHMHTHTHTNSHQMNQNETTAVSLTRSSRMETGKSNMHIFTGWARALCRLNRDLGSILPDGESAGCCPGACFILWECCSPLSALSLIHNSLPSSLSLPFKSECTGALYFAHKNCSPLSVYFSSLVTRSTNRNLLQLSLKLSCHLLLSHQETVRNLNDSTSSQRFLLHIVSLSNNLQTM